jgi:hypothetical protein
MAGACHAVPHATVVSSNLPCFKGKGDTKVGPYPERWVQADTEIGLYRSTCSTKAQYRMRRIRFLERFNLFRCQPKRDGGRCVFKVLQLRSANDR